MYLTHHDLSLYEIIDIETDSLQATQIWCAVSINAGTQRATRLVGREAIKAWIEAHPQTIWVGHNALTFDIVVLRRLLGLNIPSSRVVDTLVLSYLYNPTQEGGHSLKSWGERFKLPKGDWTDFSRYVPEMLDYCEQDGWITLRLFLSLTDRMRKRGFSERSCELEHRAREIIDDQQRNGWFFDIEAARNLYDRLRGGEEQLKLSIQELFPPVLKEQGTYQRRFKQDGSDFVSYQKHLERYPRLTINDDGTYTTWDYQEFNIGSPVQRVDRLLSLGWIPTRFTPKKFPQVDEDALLAFAEESGEAAVGAMAEWLVHNGRANMINTWLNNVGPDSRIHGWVNSCGAQSRRMTHSAPNTANVPGNEARFGHDCRELWTVHDKRTRRIVGHDAKAAQMRMFGHYLGDPETAKLYIEGDPHQVNADNVGIPRSPMKNVFYAFIFGAWDPKLGSTAGSTRRDEHKSWSNSDFGSYIRTTLYRSTPGLENLIRSIESEWDRTGGWIECIDGGWVRCPKKSAALNYKIQSAEACLMKQASIYIEERSIREGLDCFKIGDIHDEGQHESCVADAERLGQIKVQSIRDAGEELRFTVPMDGDYKIGLSWAETH